MSLRNTRGGSKCVWSDDFDLLFEELLEVFPFLEARLREADLLYRLKTLACQLIYSHIRIPTKLLWWRCLLIVICFFIVIYTNR